MQQPFVLVLTTGSCRLVLVGGRGECETRLFTKCTSHRILNTERSCTERGGGRKENNFHTNFWSTQMRAEPCQAKPSRQTNKQINTQLADTQKLAGGRQVWAAKRYSPRMPTIRIQDVREGAPVGGEGAGAWAGAVEALICLPNSTKHFLLCTHTHIARHSQDTKEPGRTTEAGKHIWLGSKWRRYRPHHLASSWSRKPHTARTIGRPWHTIVCVCVWCVWKGQGYGQDSTANGHSSVQSEKWPPSPQSLRVWRARGIQGSSKSHTELVCRLIVNPLTSFAAAILLLILLLHPSSWRCGTSTAIALLSPRFHSLWATWCHLLPGQSEIRSEG